jgi:hypothetical protein
MLESSSIRQTTEDDMNYQTMQFQAREKQQQLRREAEQHRFARQARGEQDEANRSLAIGKLAAALIVVASAVAAAIALI